MRLAPTLTHAGTAQLPAGAEATFLNGLPAWPTEFEPLMWRLERE